MFELFWFHYLHDGVFIVNYIKQKKVSRRLEDTGEQTVHAAVKDAVSSMLPSMSDTIQSETLPGWLKVWIIMLV